MTELAAISFSFSPSLVEFEEKNQLLLDKVDTVDAAASNCGKSEVGCEASNTQCVL